MLLAACGGGGEQPQVAKGTTPVSLRITSWLVEQPSVEAYKAHLAEPFKQESPNTITVEPMAFAAHPEKIQAYGASGDLLDIIEVSYAWWTMMGIGNFYDNQSMFDREGQKNRDENWTWNQAVGVAKRLTKSDQQWYLHIGSYEASLLYAYGGSASPGSKGEERCPSFS